MFTNWRDDMFAVKVYIRDTETLLAACDEELLGRTLRSDGARLTVSKIFYHGDVVDECRLKEMMSAATSMNLVGGRTISAARELGLVSESGTIVVEGVEHAQVVRM